MIDIVGISITMLLVFKYVVENTVVIRGIKNNILTSILVIFVFFNQNVLSKIKPIVLIKMGVIFLKLICSNNFYARNVF